jgi:hypothetical protein
MWKALFLTNKLFNQIIKQAFLSITPLIIQQLTDLVGTTPYDIASILNQDAYIQCNQQKLKTLYAVSHDQTDLPAFDPEFDVITTYQDNPLADINYLEVIKSKKTFVCIP